MPVVCSMTNPQQGVDNANGPLVTLGGTIGGAGGSLAGWAVYIRNPDSNLPELKDQTAQLNINTGDYTFSARVAYGHYGQVYGEVQDNTGTIVATTTYRDVDLRDKP